MTAGQIRGTIKASKQGAENEMGMDSWIRRFMRCGMPEETATQIVVYLFQKKMIVELMRFLRITEEATGNR